MDRGAWQALVHGITKSGDMTERLTHNKQSWDWKSGSFISESYAILIARILYHFAYLII